MADDGNIADLVTQASTLVITFKNTIYNDCIKAADKAKKGTPEIRLNAYETINLAIITGGAAIEQISTYHKQALDYAKATYPKGITSAWANSGSFEECRKIMQQYIGDLGFKKNQLDVAPKVAETTGTLNDRINSFQSSLDKYKTKPKAE
ncbi:hypothetical protein JXM83_07500 [Candidatus Woesearchaeota archaeon]|nr:hypothetical protein [Candidatus Woesearchaeota archaeon]